MRECSAPGKVILFGEHAVVFGEPALAIAINRRTIVRARPSSEWTLNGEPLSKEKRPYVRTCVELAGQEEPLNLTILSQLPPAAGMGSSAAVSVATLGLLISMQERFSAERIARLGFEVEVRVQGNASPIDTTTSSKGKAVFVSRKRETNFLWLIEKDGKKWYMHSREIPKMKIVVGDTGVKGPTGPLIEQVKKLVRKSEQAAEVVKRIGEITVDGVKAMADNDLGKLGELMTRNHKLLNELGVGHPLLDKYVEAALPLSYGAKLTGAGGGGSMIALTEEPEEVARSIHELGGKSYIVETEKEGVRLDVG